MGDEMDDEAFARMLQQQLLEEEQQALAAAGPAPTPHTPGAFSQPPPSQEEIDDMEFARRLQEEEARAAEGASSAASNHQGGKSQQEIEDEDARLARMMMESGMSLRDMNLPNSEESGGGGGGGADALAPSTLGSIPQETPYHAPAPASGTRTPPPNAARAAPFSSTAGASAQMRQPISPSPYQQPGAAMPPAAAAPGRKPPPQYSPPNSREFKLPGQSAGAVPRAPNFNRAASGGSTHSSTGGSGHSRQYQGGVSRSGNAGPPGTGVASRPRQKAPPTASMPNQPPDMPGLPGDVNFDIPTKPSKKEKKKKKGIFGFGRRKDSDDSVEILNSSSGVKPRATPAARNSTGEEQRSSTDFEPDTPIVPFPIPKPVSRPADTIGAPKGPLPYSLSVSRDAPTEPAATVRTERTLVGRAAQCAVCMKPAPKPLAALDKKYHPDCFRCITCQQKIDASGSFAFIESNGQKQPMHRQCYAELYGIKCAVCKQSIPAGPDGRISFVKHPFFDTEQMCPRHARSMTRRCTGCHRFEPETEPFADLNDVGRCVCLACCRTVIVDSSDAQPLWEEVVEFFDTKLHLPIWKDFREVPILIVGYQALNDQMSSNNNVHGGASQIMTRGLCLTEHQSGRKFQMNRMKWDRQNLSFVAVDAEQRGFTFFQVPDASKVNPDASVTAILCLSGLPRDLTASVLAHEATHAWIKLHPRFDIQKPIPPQVEEGVAQLIALLFLNDGLAPAPPLEYNDGSGPSDEKLRQYFKFSIETDDHEIYGTGYRRAAMAYSQIGIEALMSHIVLYQDFPEV